MPSKPSKKPEPKPAEKPEPKYKPLDIFSPGPSPTPKPSEGEKTSVPDDEPRPRLPYNDD